MIQVKIAGAIDERSVGSIRGVLIDPSEAERLPPQPLVVPGEPAANDPSPLDRRTASTFSLVRAAVLLAALGAAWWVAQSVVEHRPAARASISQNRVTA